jgi:hypothetical protein
MNALQEKAKQSSAPPIGGLAQAGSQAAPAGAQSQAPQDADAAQDSSLPDDEATEKESSDGGETTVKLRQDYSRMQEALKVMLDNLGLPRDFSIPYLEESMESHIKSVAAAATEKGAGLSGTILLSNHHASGRGHGSPDGETVGYAAEKLKKLIIPKGHTDDAKAALSAARRLVNDLGKMLGDKTPQVVTALSALKVVSAHDGENMTAMDFVSALINIVNLPILAAARAHSMATHGGVNVQRTVARARKSQ